MAKVFFILTILSICLINSVFCENEGTSEYSFAKELDESNFKEAIATNNHFVMFFAPWCGHCKRLHPLWEQLAEELNTQVNTNVIIAKVDCTKDQPLCGKYEITGYPTLRFFKMGVPDSIKFKGTRDVQAITDFIKEQLKTEKKDENAEQKKEEVETTKQSVYELTDENFARHVSSGNHFVKFYAPWCSHCQNLAPMWELLGEALSTTEGVSIARIDCTAHRPICQDFEVKGYPTLLWIESGKKIEKYTGSREVTDMLNYVRKMLIDTTLKIRDLEDAEVVYAEPQDKTVPLKLNKDNFDEETEKGVVFVKFFAPWCGHCQQMAPTWESLAAKMHEANNGIKIAKVDCTEMDNKGLCVEQQVEGYPTLFAYKNGERQPEYNGGRSLSDLQHYITSLLGHTEL